MLRIVIFNDWVIQSDGAMTIRHTNCYVVQRYKGIESLELFLIFQ
jgi:hypothetical protein